MNDSTVTLTFAGMTYAGYSREALLAAGVSSEAVSDAFDLKRREAIKAECRRRIYAVGSSEAQMNVTSLTAAISAKAPADRSVQETAIIATAGQSIEWVSAMRGRFAELAADADADYLADACWPACPTPVIDLYAQF